MEAAGYLMSKGQQEENAGTKYLRLAETLKSQMRAFLQERQEDGVRMIQDAGGDNLDLGYYL